MPSLISKYPLDLTGRSPTNLVAGEKQLLLNRGSTPYRVVSFSQGGFYTPSLKVYDKNFKMLRKDVDYIATYKHIDASAYVGIEICSTVVILNPLVVDYVLLGGQLVGADFAFSLTAEDDTITYLQGLPQGAVPVWAGYIGDEPQWQPGELQEDRWERHHYGNLNASIERLTAAITSGNGLVEDEVRQDIRTRYQQFMARFTGQIAAHINNMDNPHNVNKADVGLPEVLNYPVANEATARAGASGIHYLTTRGVFNMLDQFGEIPMKAHIDARYTTHNPTAVQLNTYTRSQFDTRADTKLPIDGTSVNAVGFMGATRAAPAPIRNMNQIELYNELRGAMPAGAFTIGQVNPARLGIGAPGPNTVLLGTGVWADFRSLYNQYTATGSTDLYWAGYQGTQAAGLANISATFANIQAYPVGTVVIFQVYGIESYSHGNGGNDPHSFYSFRACIRGGGGWFVLG
jgi:hypothetical protein